MVNFHILKQLMELSESKQYPDLIREWEVADGAKCTGGYSFTLENQLNHNKISDLSDDDRIALEKYHIDYMADGFKKLYDLNEVIDYKYTKDRTDKVIEVLCPELIDVLSAKSLMAESKYNHGDPEQDIAFLKKVTEEGAADQTVRSRIYALFAYDAKSTRKIASYCNTQMAEYVKHSIANSYPQH